MQSLFLMVLTTLNLFEFGFYIILFSIKVIILFNYYFQYLKMLSLKFIYNFYQIYIEQKCSFSCLNFYIDKSY
jgi:hypothetical protein